MALQIPVARDKMGKNPGGGRAVRKLFPKEYWLSWLGAAVFLAAVFPYAMLSGADTPATYDWFCVVMSAVSAVLFRTILLRIWVKRFYSDSFRVYAWLLAVQAFCHLVFTGMNPCSWACIGICVILWLWMLVAWRKEQKTKDPV